MRLFIRPTIAVLIALAASALAAQELRAITEDGRKVLLSPDGKWRLDTRITTGQVSPSGSSSPYQPAVKKFSVAYDTRSWTLLPPKDADSPNMRTFQHKSLPVYAMVISDEMPGTAPLMREVILNNARSAGATPTVLLDDSDEIDGKLGGQIRFAASIKGMDFVFASRYYADADGNIQVTCWTGQSLFFKYQNECKQFSNGLSIR